MNDEHKGAYLGDGLYVEIDTGMLRVYTVRHEDAGPEIHEVFLGPSELSQLISFAFKNGDDDMKVALIEECRNVVAWVASEQLRKGV